MSIIRWIVHNILFLFTLFLLAFIPLYPKLPILDVTHTWVYIRLEDFIIASILLVWMTLLLFKKVSLRTPLTIPILLFWIMGALATIHAMLLIFPSISGAYSNVAFLSLLRRIEYLSLFFIAYASMKDKRFVPYVIFTLTITLLLVFGYGMGQKFFGFPAFLTMNEEFAKGVPIQLSSLSRVPSTFAGHYDLAAYLVLIIPIFVSVFFGVKNFLVKGALLIVAMGGFWLLFMTVSRVSFFVLLASLAVLLALHKKRLLIVVLLLIFFVFLSFSQGLTDRFASTITEVDVLVDAKTGEAIGHVKDIPSTIFKDKLIIRQNFQSTQIIYGIKKEEGRVASPSAIVPFSSLPPSVFVLSEPNAPTGENLPQGTGYINLYLAPVKERIGDFFYEVSEKEGGKSNEVLALQGNFLVKRASAYDLSFTTRFQGEWPKAIEALKRNILFGSGYSSLNLAVDNNYLRILGEVGVLGFVTFFSIFIFASLYIKRVLPSVDSPLIKSLVIGFVAGTTGLILNAVLIDVFEASKIAFTFWLLMGVILGVLKLYQKETINLYSDFKKIISSSFAIVVYLGIATLVLFWALPSYYFVGDDFTWLRWAADCKKVMVDGSLTCQPLTTTIINFFTDANGFFYRPGTKVYFLFMYLGFWLNQNAYHGVSIILHFLVTVLVFFISKKILKNVFLAVSTAFLFLIMSGYSEATFWISSTGFLFNAVFTLSSLLWYMVWKEQKKKRHLIFSFLSIGLSLLFHEIGVIAPLLVVAYDLTSEDEWRQRLLQRKRLFFILLSPIVPYLLLRYVAHSHWFSGDYSYNVWKLPFNIVGNTFGYLLLSVFGPMSLSLYQGFRSISRENIIISAVALMASAFIAVFFYRMVMKKIAKEEAKTLVFASLFYIIALLPFLGLGNISSRYSYLSSFGIVLFFVFFLKRAYRFIGSSGQAVALMSMVVVVLIFSFAHLMQLQKISSDWKAAGEKSKRFLISFSNIYPDYKKKGDMQFYFVNVPLKIGEAWVFPVGLKDALWFILRNERLAVFQLNSVETALDAASVSKRARVFVFNQEGGVFEVRRIENSNEIVTYKGE